mmetsp:Transcript_112274/g.349862  ORF Transcript_112274/g.349862 Transcript_112274/m.349862 type:complete len:202 (-) Transcript_112274:268-873(-)
MNRSTTRVRALPRSLTLWTIRTQTSGMAGLTPLACDGLLLPWGMTSPRRRLRLWSAAPTKAGKATWTPRTSTASWSAAPPGPRGGTCAAGALRRSTATARGCCAATPSAAAAAAVAVGRAAAAASPSAGRAAAGGDPASPAADPVLRWTWAGSGKQAATRTSPPAVRLACRAPPRTRWRRLRRRPQVLLLDLTRVEAERHK